ncbi:hypothetical protein EB008_05490 [bacterium]|nr:hypothetical protein [bacterium]
MSIPLGTPSYKIKHDFKSDFSTASDVKDEDSKFYSEQSWAIVQQWKAEAEAARLRFLEQKKNLSAVEGEVVISTSIDVKRSEGN